MFEGCKETIFSLPLNPLPFFFFFFLFIQFNLIVAKKICISLLSELVEMGFNQGYIEMNETIIPDFIEVTLCLRRFLHIEGT